MSEADGLVKEAPLLGVGNAPAVLLIFLGSVTTARWSMAV